MLSQTSWHANPGEAASAAPAHLCRRASALSGDPAGARGRLGPSASAADRDGWEPALATRSRLCTTCWATSTRAGGARPGDPAEVPADVRGLEWLAFRVQLMARLGRREQTSPLAIETLRPPRHSVTPGPRGRTPRDGTHGSRVARKEAHHEQALRAATETGDAVTAIRRPGQPVLLPAGRRALRRGQRRGPGRRPARRSSAARPAGWSSRCTTSARRCCGSASTARRCGSCSGRSPCSVGSARAAARMGLLGIGEIHRDLGHDEQAGPPTRRPLELGRASGELQVLVPALSGLARLQAVAHHQPAPSAEEARDRDARACSRSRSTRLGWVSLVAGRPGSAWAAEAVTRPAPAGAPRRPPRRFAGAGCRGRSGRNAAVAPRRGAGDLAGRRCRAGHRPDRGAARLAARRGRRPRSRARDAARRLQRDGVLHVQGRPLGDGRRPPRSHRRARRFRRHRGPAARTADRLALAAGSHPGQAPCRPARPSGHPGRGLRAALAGRRPLKTGHRLSVLLATVRGVLDPEQGWPPDHYVSADLRGLWLDLSHVELDADGLLRDADLAAALMDDGERERASEILTDIDARLPRRRPRGRARRGVGRRLPRAGPGRLAARAAPAGVAAPPVRDGRPTPRCCWSGCSTRTRTTPTCTSCWSRRWSACRPARRGPSGFARWGEAMRAIDAPLPDPIVLRPDGRGAPTGGRARPVRDAHVQLIPRAAF